ncbi:MAG: phasin family protein [Sphingobium sp.]|uniref:phasin family protein n=1 Tax=Sphingobium sp. TaxID=1912891 RepID=UPI002E20FDE0
MAETPKTGRGPGRPKAASPTLSASEVLKAAETAITPPAAPKPARKPVQAAVKPIDTNPSRKAPAPAPEEPKETPPPPPPTDQVAVIAATTAVDAAPEPEAELEAPLPGTSKSLPETAIEDAVPLPALEGTTMMNEVIETGKKFAEDTKAKFETAYADFNEKTKAHVEKSTKAIEEMSDIAKGNVEAMVEAGKIAAKGMEVLGQEAVDYTRKSFEKATASFKSFSTVKTPTEFFQLQSQMLSASFDDFTKEAAKHSEAMVKLAGDVAQPLTARVTLVTDKVKSLAA